MHNRPFVIASSSILAVAVAAGLAPKGALAAPTPPPAPSEVTAQPPDDSILRDARMKWWRDARFGMFIHWGVYAVPAGTYKDKRIGGIGEWIMRNGKVPVADYKAFARQFNPVKYRPDTWMDLAKKAGMKYVVITSKHHDGFSLYDSKVTDWDIADATPYKKDLLAPLAKAARARGLKFGLYYSQAQDWTHPGGAKSKVSETEAWDDAHKGSFEEYLRKIAVPQAEEILVNFKPDILWWDTPFLMTKERADLFRPLVLARPLLVTNNRLGGGWKGDTDTPEQHIPATGIPGRDWEVCMTMNDTWGFKSYDDNWKSTTDLVRKLSDIASKGGNFLLNVGPTAEGEIPQPSVDRLQDMGGWMKVNGEAIYGTTASPFARLAWGRATKKERKDGTTLYLHVFDWTSDGRLLAPGLRGRVGAAKLLAGGKKVAAEVTAEGLVLSSLPAAAPDARATVIKVDVKGPLVVDRVLPRPGSDGRIALSPREADVHNVLGTDARIEGKGADEHIGNWGDARAWVAYRFDVARPGKYEVAAELAADNPVKLRLGAGNSTNDVTTPATGGPGKFQQARLGTVTFDKPGEQELTLKPDKEQWSALGLRKIVLTPQSGQP